MSKCDCVFKDVEKAAIEFYQSSKVVKRGGSKITVSMWTMHLNSVRESIPPLSPHVVVEDRITPVSFLKDPWSTTGRGKKRSCIENSQLV